MSEPTKRLFSWGTLPWVLLALSVALNVFFVGGHVYTRVLIDRVTSSHAKPHAGRSLSARLKLTAAQRKSFGELRRKMRERRREYRRASRDESRQLWRAIGDPDAKSDAIDKHLKTLADNRLGFNRDAAEYMRAFVLVLNKDQRKRFLRRARRRNLFDGGSRRGRRHDRRRAKPRDR